MRIDQQVRKVRTSRQNWALLGDFNHAAKSIVNPVTYQEVPLTNLQRANRLLKQFGRFSNNFDDPQLYIASREWIISCLDIADLNEKYGVKNYTINHVKNDILKMIVKDKPLKIVV